MTPGRWPQIESIVAQALEIPSAERQEWLAAACGDDAELRREVESLLAFDRPEGLRLTAALGQAAVAWTDPETRRIGPYRLTGLLGSGGMGVVYAAVRDDDEFDRKVAIKLVGAGSTGPETLTRFRHERQILASLQHPNIAQLFDGGTTPEGTPYLVMEFVEGVPLHEYCRTHHLNTRQRLDLFRAVCSAVQYAHQHLIVHRDLKPANILVTASGDVKLLDFGIAKLVADGGPQTATLTGGHLLTPDYASPEQVRGEPVTTLSDVYSLGAILYELLSLEKPHRFKDYSPAEIARAVTTAPITRPSEAVAARRESALRRQLEGDLDNIVLKAMHKDKLRRYSSVEQLSEDIRRHLSGLPVSARPETLPYRVGKFVSRHKLGIAAALLIAAGVATATGAAIYQGRRAERRFAQVRRLANTFLFTFHDKIANLQGATEARELVVKTALEYLDSLERDAAGDPQLRRELAQAYIKVGDVQGNPRAANLGHYREAIDSYGRARRLAAALYQQDSFDLAAARLLATADANRGDIQVQMLGDPTSGIRALRSGLDLLRGLLTRPGAAEQDYSFYVRNSSTLGDALIEDNPPAAGEAYREGLRVARLLVEHWPSAESEYRLSTTWQRIGRLQHERGDPAGCIQAYREAEKILSSLTARFPTDARFRRELATVYGWLGNASGHPEYFNIGDLRAAADYFQRAHRIVAETAAADPKNRQAQMDTLIDAAKLAAVLAASGQTRDALKYANECLDRLELGKPASGFMDLRLKTNCLDARARVEAAALQYSRTLSTLDEERAANAIVRAKAPSDDLGVEEVDLWIHLERAAAWGALRQEARAEAELETALTAAERLHKQTPADLYFLRDLADTYEARARLAYAEARAGSDPEKNRAAGGRFAAQARELWEQWSKLAGSSAYTQANRARIVALEEAGGQP